MLGLVGLGVVVFVHELGHFIAARLVGIDVEAFSIGWGKPFLKKKLGSVEYRLGIFPLGGYCKMRGENEFQEAWENHEREVRAVKGSFFGAGPFRRILVAFMGPFFNLIFACLVLTVIWGRGFEINTLENRVVLVSDIQEGVSYPADEGGLKTGDRIIEIKGRPIATYHDIQENIAVHPEENLPLRVDRDGRILDLLVRPSLEKSTGAGKIGVYFWTNPLVGEVVPGSPADIGGIRPGDSIVRINGESLPYTVKLIKLLQDRPPVLKVGFLREGEEKEAELILSYDDDGNTEIGLGWKTLKFHTPRLSPLAALSKGLEETYRTLTVSLRSLTLLFRGIDLTKAVSGPVRITYMVGDAAAEGFGQSIGAGISSMANFLALISIAL
ncbi:MAG: site-2 protease family protein, partial [Treponema sp.]|nr:site-2 protease family protein [Treponema sp.]